MMSAYARRIVVLEARYRAAGCATCRPWRAPARVEIIRPEQWAAMPKVPAVCPACRRPVPHMIRAIVIERLERTPDDATL